MTPSIKKHTTTRKDICGFYSNFHEIINSLYQEFFMEQVGCLNISQQIFP